MFQKLLWADFLNKIHMDLSLLPLMIMGIYMLQLEHHQMLVRKIAVLPVIKAWIHVPSENVMAAFGNSVLMRQINSLKRTANAMPPAFVTRLQYTGTPQPASFMPYSTAAIS